VKLPSSNISHIALKPLLVRHIQEAIYLSKETLRRDKVSDLSQQDYLSKDREQAESVPLTKINRGSFAIEYGSAIALKLSRASGEQSVDVARTIVAHTISAYLTNSIKAVGDKIPTAL